MWFAGFMTTFSLFLEEKVRLLYFVFFPSGLLPTRSIELTVIISSFFLFFLSFPQRRRSELALYVLPRGLSVLHSMLRKRAWIPRHVPLGEGVLAGLAMAILCDRSRWGQEDLGGLVKRGESLFQRVVRKTRALTVSCFFPLISFSTDIFWARLVMYQFT